MENLRISFLREILRVNWLREAFRDRATRLALFFGLSVLLYFPLALFFPLWLLALGPLVWGVPHIFSSFRYQSRMVFGGHSQTLKTRRVLMIFVTFWLAVSAFRLATDVFNLRWNWDFTHPGFVELIVAILLPLSLATLCNLTRLQFIQLCLIAVPLTYLTWHCPLETAGVLILAHNFFAFGYWMASAPRGRERAVAIVSLGVFSLIHILVFAKVFDSLINLGPVRESLAWSQLSVSQIGRLISPWSQDWSLWYRGVLLYAFGQSVHYFIWLKAIPDLHAPSPLPTNFHLSWSLLKRDYGARVASWIAVIAFLPVTVWFLSHFFVAYSVYFALASVHGYFEAVGLALVVGRIQNT